MGQRKRKYTLYRQPESRSVQLGQPLHSIRGMHDVAVWKRIAQQISDLIGSLANQGLWIDGKPAALTAVKNVVVMQIAMQRDYIALGR